MIAFQKGIEIDTESETETESETGNVPYLLYNQFINAFEKGNDFETESDTENESETKTESETENVFQNLSDEVYQISIFLSRVAIYECIS